MDFLCLCPALRLSQHQSIAADPGGAREPPCGHVLSADLVNNAKEQIVLMSADARRQSTAEIKTWNRAMDRVDSSDTETIRT